MTKYRKKPVIIEAIQYLREENLSSCMDFCPDMVFNAKDNEYDIKTLEGNMKVSKGDYIIKGVQGEFYPCKPDIFEMTYEKVNGENPEIMTKETSLNVIVESLIEGEASFLMTCPSCDKSTISSQQVYIHDNIKREWYCRNCGQKLNNHNLLKEV